MKILVIDKDLKLRTLVKTRLEARDYEVTEKATSQEAIRSLSKDSFDLILLSTAMESVDGKLVVEHIRRTPHLMSVPVIMMAEENQIAELVLSHKRGFDDFLIKPFSPLVLQLRVGMNIDRARKRIEANALTQLPGNPTIERVIRKKIENGEKFSVLYIDINNFKSFNDRYGFKKGDDVIRQTAHLLLQTAQEVTGEDDSFVGHVGGDDFIVVVSPQYEEPYARAFIELFDRIMPTYYNEEDRQNGAIRVKNRQGEEQNFPIMSCSIAGCTNLYRPYENLGEIAQDAAAVKNFLKLQSGGSHYLRDRRAMPIENLEEAMEVLSPNLEADTPKTQENLDPLGKTLLNAGLITEDQLTVALAENIKTGKRLGEVLISMKAVKSEDVGRMLEKKLNVPYISLRHFMPSHSILRLFTRDFIVSRRVIPLESNSQGLKLAMCDPFDLRTLDTIERVTTLKPIPYLALEDEFEDFLENHINRKDGPFGEKTGS